MITIANLRHRWDRWFGVINYKKVSLQCIFHHILVLIMGKAEV